MQRKLTSKACVRLLFGFLVAACLLSCSLSCSLLEVLAPARLRSSSSTGIRNSRAMGPMTTSMPMSMPIHDSRLPKHGSRASSSRGRRGALRSSLPNRRERSSLRWRCQSSPVQQQTPQPNGQKNYDLGKHFTPNSIRHPLDQQYTMALQNLPGIDVIIRSLAGSVAEQLLELDNVGRGVKVGPKQAPRIYKLLEEACEILQMPLPALYIRQNPSPNAYTLAISGRQPLIVVHTSLIDLMSDQELQAVIAHELGHLKCEHGVWLLIANLFSLGATRLLPIPILVDSIEDAIMRWARSAELTCDRAAMVVAQDPEVVVSVLMKLAGGCASLDGQLDVKAFLEQARTYEEASASPIGWYLRNAEAKQLSHPLPVMRAKEIDRWSRSPEYRRLVKQTSTTSSSTTTKSQ